MSERIKVNKVDSDYGWAKCVCGNTVKFDLLDATSVCPACSRQWTIWNSADEEAVHERIELEV